MSSNKHTHPKVHMNPHVVRAEYAVRGLIPARADEIKKEIAEGKGAHPFTSLVYCNIGNPQSLGQKPLTFNRQVMALFDAPFLLEDEALVARFPADAVARAKEYLSHIGTATGAYTASFGYDFAREAVAAHINERDHHVQPEATLDAICLTDGASSGVKVFMQLLIGGTGDGVMLPIPQYPLYTAQLALLGGTLAPYYLREKDGWAMQADDLAAAYEQCELEHGATPRLLVCINPGNPTGGVLDRKVMEDVVRFCYDYNVLLLADEVYQENIYAADRKFVSFREVVLSMPAPYSTGTMLVSLHSTSKGIIGECGRRGGYFCMTNLPSPMREQVTKMCSINLCANVSGQIMTALMSTPPQKGDASYESYWAEYNGIFSSLKERAALLARELNTIRGMSCQLVQGAMYAFPQITLPARYAEYNEAQNKKEGRKLALDARWSLELLEATGIVVVPGSGFGQEPNTLHFRTTILPPTAQMERMVAAIRDFQEKVYKDYA
ncbi:putative mitochondrial alanine aminotransferase (ALAT) [Leptomonas pyrrhocoris]|uniref:Putative mitochondrial alanine aminotransferase (ALAT) n=2 Tax=Leptomonas pyrrhocoris TaxID=157538 RepID=A0A0M9FTP6_LEPPY|nr:putative mitochondrial alanine aminotransferase (ALAT) [Leptomonas pyrrhocoris]XP_015654177.1 putative mitochondrial alanine aminotransferase (ALAT) [Leptomonas pyrrhocoris]XP_015654178.1 putative mitochondrial alanine aminotransferase (ALAT) [Leptomonas pyrrhocoris]KPA75737.1 putative mitochondrial alanine aminotransferase (ALAT) [Leptomonas pyrrhocoris]KPA75738.1 putative mitochondrial alanine aminotransferase (ALAT) [Leptomonas pyrrhocoris]KPA75739.1 putative mitochondrial alanine aminot|eukprot:XP_015654176.1 putative mitochondrial alanine aminotransferase (ALAT) [Leptomonas pyrrhocoris]